VGLKGLKCKEIRTAFLQVLPTEFFWKLNGLHDRDLLQLAADADASIHDSRKHAMYQQNAGAGSFHNRNLNHLTAVPVMLFRNSTLRCTRSKLACLVWKLQPTKSGTTNTKTKTVAHNRVREKNRVHLHNHKTLPRQNLRTIPNGVFITTYGDRSRKCKEPCSFDLDRPNVQQLHSKKLNKSSTDPFADIYNTHWCYYHNQYGDHARNCTFPCSYIKDNSSHSQYSKNSPFRHSDTLFWVRDKISNRIFSGFWCLRVGFACYANSYLTC